MAALLYEYRSNTNIRLIVSFPIPGSGDNARGSSRDSLVLSIIHLHELRLHEILEKGKERRKEREKSEREMAFVLDRGC